jgi:glycine dehydrogenase subunit 1
MGAEGLVEAARQCHAKAVYAAGRIAAVPGFSLQYGGEFFHEFATRCPDARKTLAALAEKGVLGGLPLASILPNADGLLWCVTEMNTKAEIDELVGILAAL